MAPLRRQSRQHEQRQHATRALRRRAVMGGGLTMAGAFGAAALGACAPVGGPTGTQSANLTGTLHYMDWEISTPAGQARWDKTVARFHEQYPDIKIEEDRSDLFWQKLPAVVAAGTPPDTADLRRQAEFPALVGKGTVRPLDPYLTKSKLIKKGDFYERTVAMNSLDGKLYALPGTLGMYVLYYNKNLFLERGLKVPDLTWDYATDFDAAAQQLGKHAGDRLAQAGVQMPTWWIIHYLGNKDIGIWQGGLTDKSKCSRVNYDQREVIEGYEWYQKHLCQWRTMEPEGDQSQTGFEQGTA
ncbi:MAG: ABC transporter substrate-binding protein, partial [Chloroflexota bacterium]